MSLRILRSELVALAASVLLLAACGGGDGDEADGERQGVTTRTPGPEATATASTPRPTATFAPAPTEPPPRGEPGAVANALAELGSGGDPEVIAGWLDIVEPRCRQSREELGPLLERGWRILNEDLGLFLSMPAMLGRLDLGLPLSGQVDCDPRIAAIVTELRNR
jgi:hypothetical protein